MRRVAIQGCLSAGARAGVMVELIQRNSVFMARDGQGTSRRNQCWTSSCWPSGSASLPPPLATPTLASGFEAASDPLEHFKGNAAMMFDYALAGLVSAGLLFYLTYALLRPEHF
jgi:K+-transporting ATPase KdpF subunit